MPGWSIGGLLAWLVVSWLSLPGWVIAAMVGALVLKDLLLFPLVVRALRPPAPTKPIGAVAHAVERLAPRGYVRIADELWDAEVTGTTPIDRDEKVRVTGARGLTLIVEPASRDDRRTAGGRA